MKLTFTVVQTERLLVHRRVRYKRSLIGWLFGLGLLLITMQLLLLRWSLAPLRKVASDMNRVERELSFVPAYQPERGIADYVRCLQANK